MNIDIDSLLTILLAGYVATLIYKYSSKKLELTHRSLFERREETVATSDRPKSV